MSVRSFSESKIFDSPEVSRPNPPKRPRLASSPHDPSILDSIPDIQLTPACVPPDIENQGRPRSFSLLGGDSPLTEVADKISKVAIKGK